MYEHLDKVEQYTGRAITRLKPPHSFEYFFYEYSPERKNPALSKYRGFSWPGPKQRWCTGRLKQRVIGAYLKELKQEYHIAQYVGIAADEAHRVREYHYPLVDWGMTEADCLRYCRERGFDWGGLYDVFRRVLPLAAAQWTAETLRPFSRTVEKTPSHGRPYLAAVSGGLLCAATGTTLSVRTAVPTSRHLSHKP